jgi:hypothetical protein
MSDKEIAEIKLSCLEKANYQCENCPENILKVAKEIFEWVIKIENPIPSVKSQQEL